MSDTNVRKGRTVYMKCQNCGKELARGSSFCPSCGAKVEAVPTAGNTVLRNIFSSSHFLAICILLTIAAVLNTGPFKILFAVACWIVYCDAKSNSEPQRVSGYKFLYTVFKIQYILVWVAAGITAVSGVVGALMILISRGFASSLLGCAVEYSADVSDALSDILAYLAKILTSIPAAVIAALSMLFLMLICAAVMCVYNGIFTRCFVKYFGGIARIAEKGDDGLETLDHSGTSVRMLVCGVLIALPAAVNMFGVSVLKGHISFKLHIGSGLGTLCFAAVYFVAYVMIQEYVKKNKGV